MNFFRLILLLILSLGIGLHSSATESMIEYEVPVPKEVVDSSFVLNQTVRVNRSTVFSTKLSYILHGSEKTEFQHVPLLSVKRHIWVMQFLL